MFRCFLKEGGRIITNYYRFKVDGPGYGDCPYVRTLKTDVDVKSLVNSLRHDNYNKEHLS